MHRPEQSARPDAGQTSDPAPSREFDAFVDDLYTELRGLAERSLRGERAGHTLQATALAHEAYLRLADQHTAHWVSRAYILSAAASVIRRILVDHARARRSQKRGGGWTAQDLGAAELCIEPTTGVLDVHEAIEELAELHPRQAQIIELRFFGGLDVDEVASALGVSPRTIANDWRVARAWMRHRLAGGG